SGDLLHSPIQFAHPQWNSAFCGDPRQAEVSRREMMAWGASHHAQWFTGHFAGPSCGWLEKDKQGDYRWREAGKQAADKG
ncbi:MBL fold metallo-hydrolase, partial [Klebsiella pneumoniae]